MAPSQQPGHLFSTQKDTKGFDQLNLYLLGNHAFLDEVSFVDDSASSKPEVWNFHIPDVFCYVGHDDGQKKCIWRSTIFRTLDFRW